MHHLFMAMPLLALVLFLFLPWPVALALYIPIVGISMFIYWKALRAIFQTPVTGKKGMLGDRAEVIDILDRGQFEVRYHGEIWHAVSTQSLQPGQEVIIEDIDGLRLRVEPSPQPTVNESGR